MLSRPAAGELADSCRRAERIRDTTSAPTAVQCPPTSVASDERDQTVDRQRHDRVERHTQSFRAPFGVDVHVR